MLLAAPIDRFTHVESPPPADIPSGTGSPLFLVVIADHNEAKLLPMMASLVSLSSGRLLVAIASPCMAFTTDLAVLWQAVMGPPREVAALAAAVDQQLAEHRAEYEVVELSYGDSPSAARRNKRIAVAADRLARKRNAIPLRERFPEILRADARTASG